MIQENSLLNLLRDISRSTNAGAISNAYEAHLKQEIGQLALESLPVTQAMISDYQNARRKILKLENAPAPLLKIIDRVQKHIESHLHVNCVTLSHFKNKYTSGFINGSCINRLMNTAHLCDTVLLFDLFNLMGRDWGINVGGSTLKVDSNIYETLSKFFKLMIISIHTEGGPSSEIWRKHLLDEIGLLNKSLDKPLSPKKIISMLQSQTDFYIPVGYAIPEMFCLHLIAVDHKDDSYRLRLLTPKTAFILAAGNRKEHWCPEVIWENLTLEQLQQLSLWECLLEPRKMQEEELSSYESRHFLSFDPQHIIAIVTKKLNSPPKVAYLQNIEFNWNLAFENRYRDISIPVPADLTPHQPVNSETAQLLLMPTGKEIKRSLLGYYAHKFINLLPLCLLPSSNDVLLFKAESRLLVLTAAYVTLLGKYSDRMLIGNFLRQLEQSYGKVTGPIEKLMQQQPSDQQRKTAEVLLISLLDLKHRIAEFARTIPLATLQSYPSHYPSMHSDYRLKLSQISWQPIERTLLDVMRLSVDIDPLPYYEQWTAERFVELHQSLESWYRLLLDAKQKCEPVEIVSLAHKNIFSRLPVAHNELFPEPVSEGLRLGTLLLLKKISSLVCSEAYTCPFIHPLLVADMALVYRLAVEIYRNVNPASCSIPVSWYCLHEYLAGRNSFHIPGEVRYVLESVAESFKQISPKGHLQPDESFKEIPLFYYSWQRLTLDYTFHLMNLGPKSYTQSSIDEILKAAELADSVGLKPEEAMRHKAAKWENCFGGQALLAVSEIAQYHTMTMLASTDAFQKAGEKNNHSSSLLTLGPEDHFTLPPVCTQTSVEYHWCRFSDSKTLYREQVVEGKPRMQQRMAFIDNAAVSEPISNLPVSKVEEWQEQAELLKGLTKNAPSKNAYSLRHIASGPATLSIPALLEYFEVRPSLLLIKDYRAYFMAIIRSAHIFEDSLKDEPLLVIRIRDFLCRLYNEDKDALKNNMLNLERILWLSALTHYCCRHSGHFLPLLAQISASLHESDKEEIAAVHLLANHFLLKEEDRLTLVEQARLHLLVGRFPPSDPNDAYIWQEACQVMQELAPVIQQALIEGEDTLRRALWGLIFVNTDDIENVIARPPMTMEISSLLKAAEMGEKLRLQQKYAERWKRSFEKRHWDKTPWREEAVSRLNLTIKELYAKNSSLIAQTCGDLLFVAQEVLCVTATTTLVKINERMIIVDWQTGRVSGSDCQIGTFLPVYLRKHPALEAIKPLLQRPLINTLREYIVSFKNCPQLTMDVRTGTVLLDHDGEQFRMVSSTELPDQMESGFSLWLNAANTGIIAAQQADGVPIPCFSVDPAGMIRPLEGNTQLRLAAKGYYTEAKVFEAWGLVPKNVLVWLNDQNEVAELHLPLHDEEHKFTRVVRDREGNWSFPGLQIRLDTNIPPIAAFAGHPVYLTGLNRDGQKIMLLISASPHAIQQRREEKNHQVEWNQILTSGAKEAIHQYTVSSNESVEGLTVADNLLLMLWTLYMGHYAATAQLAKKWLTPPARTYTDNEQRILLSWIYSVDQNLMGHELHPSALALRLYVLVRIARHLKNFPPAAEEGKQMPLLWRELAGPHNWMNFARDHIKTELLHSGLLHRQLRTTEFHKLISIYDHECALRYFIDMKYPGKSPLFLDLYQRITRNRLTDPEENLTITYNIEGNSIHCYKSSFDHGKYYIKEFIISYPTTVQRTLSSMDIVTRRSTLADLIEYFDQLYLMIQKQDIDDPMFLELETTLCNLRQMKFESVCLRRHVRPHNFCYETFRDESAISWILLQQAYLAKKAGHELPPLPSLDRRFGLLVDESKKASKKFVYELVKLSGKTPRELYEEFFTKFFDSRQIRYLEQERLAPKVPDSFIEDLKAPWSKQLTTEITRWARLMYRDAAPMRDIDIPERPWTNTIPKEWASLPMSKLKRFVEQRAKKVSLAKARHANTLLMMVHALPEGADASLRELARQMHYFAPLSIDECIGLALIGQKERWKECSMTGDPLKLQEATLKYLDIALEADHLQRIEKLIQSCLVDPQDKDLEQQLRDAVHTEHCYLPGSAALPLMAAEYYSDCRLRNSPDQAGLIRLLTADRRDYKGCVIQAIMGSGKSKMLAPIWLQMMLGSGRIPILCVPTSLFRTTLSDLQGMMWDRFKTHVRALNFHRETCTSDTLHALAETLHIGGLEPTVFVCTPRDLHALQLMLKERHQIIEDMRNRLLEYTSTWADSCNLSVTFKKHLKNGHWDEAKKCLSGEQARDFERWYNSHQNIEKELQPLFAEADLLQALLNLLRSKAALLVDEVATVYDPRNMLSFPIGWQTAANPQAAVMACKVYFEWLPEHFGTLGLLDNMQSLSDQEKREGIYRTLAEKAFHEYKELIPDLPGLRHFTAYMFSQETMGAAMKTFVDELNKSQSVLNVQYAQELAFLKYCLTDGLEGALTTTAHVNYGRSKQDPDLYLAIPYQCANVPKENTLFRRPWKTVLMTCQYYSQEWKDNNQTKELIAYLRGVDAGNREVLQAAETIWGNSFTNSSLDNEAELDQFTSTLHKSRFQPEKAKSARLLIQTYLQCCVFPAQLKLDPAQLTSTPQDIPMIAAKADAMGGTFGFEKTWNTKLKREPDYSCDMNILKALKEERNQTCHRLPKGGAKAILGQFKAGKFKNYMALVDAGALFKGVSNAKVARMLLKYFNKQFDCVLFYDEQHDGARLAIMSLQGKTVLEDSGKEGVRRALSQLKLNTPFAYYDQARRIGADLDLPPGNALITFSNSVTCDDLLQSAMRCRGLLTGQHSVSYVIPGEMRIFHNGNQVIEQAKKQQQACEEKANFHGICEQLRGAVRAAIDNAMRGTADSKERQRIYQAAGNILMEKQENDLVKVFGKLHTKVYSKQALKRLLDDLVKNANQILTGSASVETTLKNILAWHEQNKTPLPTYVREGDVQDDAVQEVDLSKDLDRMRLMEDEYERMLGSRVPKKEVEWTHFNPQDLLPTPMGCVTGIEGMPTLHLLKDALYERGFHASFDGNLLISANLLFTFMGESNCLLTPNQKPVHRGLLYRDGEDSGYILVSEGDARLLKDHLIKTKMQGLYLVEPNGTINQRSHIHEEITNLWADGSPQERRLLLQALIFQGAALTLSQLPHEEVAEALAAWQKEYRGALEQSRILLEAALNQRPDDLQHYRRQSQLRKLFY